MITQKDIDELDADTLFERMKNGVGPGWLSIIEKCHQTLRDSSPEYKPVQIKEKFGGLRFYVTGVEYGTPAYAAIEEAERTSEVTCEECGKPGEAHSVGSSYRTLCDADYEQAIETRRLRMEGA